jgi:hypothetical protein
MKDYYDREERSISKKTPRIKTIIVVIRGVDKL